MSLVTSEIHKGLQEYNSPLSSVRQDALSRLIYVVSQRTGATQEFADKSVKSALGSSGLGLAVLHAVTERLALHVQRDASKSSQLGNEHLSADEIHLSVHLLQVIMLTLEDAAKALDLRFTTTPTKVRSPSNLLLPGIQTARQLECILALTDVLECHVNHIQVYRREIPQIQKTLDGTYELARLCYLSVSAQLC
jgi:hypothetical protein